MKASYTHARNSSSMHDVQAILKFEWVFERPKAFVSEMLTVCSFLMSSSKWTLPGSAAVTRSFKESVIRSSNSRLDWQGSHSHIITKKSCKVSVKIPHETIGNHSVAGQVPLLGPDTVETEDAYLETLWDFRVRLGNNRGSYWKLLHRTCSYLPRLQSRSLLKRFQNLTYGQSQ